MDWKLNGLICWIFYCCERGLQCCWDKEDRVSFNNHDMAMFIEKRQKLIWDNLEQYNYSTVFRNFNPLRMSSNSFEIHNVCLYFILINCLIYNLVSDCYKRERPGSKFSGSSSNSEVNVRNVEECSQLCNRDAFCKSFAFKWVSFKRKIILLFIIYFLFSYCDKHFGILINELFIKRWTIFLEL